jgi:4-amino-4-deoxy-L-arabinose transferase-like glycosyltransferase
LHRGESFLAVQLMRENVARLTGVEGYEVGHHKPFFFSAIDLFVGFLPWSLFSPLLIVWLWMKRRMLRQDLPLLFALVWVGVFIVVVSIADSKRPVYLLPAFPPLSFLLASAISNKDALVFPRSRRISAVLLALLAVSCVGITAIIGVITASALPALDLSAQAAASLNLAQEIARNSTLLFPVLALATLVVIFAAGEALRGHLPRSAFALGTTLLVVIALVGHSIQPQFARANSPRAFIAAAQKFPAPLLQYKREYFPLLYYSAHCIGVLPTVQELGPNSAYVIMRSSESAAFGAQCPSATFRGESVEQAADGDERLVLLEVSGGCLK